MDGHPDTPMSDDAMRIVTLLPGATEIVCALGLADQLVAVSHECDYPEIVQSLPKATRSNISEGLSPKEVDDQVVQAVEASKALYTVDGDLLATLRPDLIVTQGICDVCAVNYETLQETVDRLPDGMGESLELVTLEGKSLDQILGDIERVARATQTEAKAATLTQDLRRRWEALQNQRPSVQPRVLALEWPDPPFFGGHWVPEMIDVAGGIDVMGQAGVDSGRCSWQEIADRDPDVILLIACGFDLPRNVELARHLYSQADSARLRAVSERRVWACDANAFFSRPGPRIVDGAEMLQAIFLGDTDGVSSVVQVLGSS